MFSYNKGDSMLNLLRDILKITKVYSSGTSNSILKIKSKFSDYKPVIASKNILVIKFIQTLF